MTGHRPSKCNTHGARYARGCPQCIYYFRTLQKTRAQLKALGQWEYMVDARPARQHLSGLLRRGMSIRQIAATTGLSRYVLFAVRKGQPQVTYVVSEAILGCPVRAPRGPVMVDATGTARRLQALAVAGYSSSDIAARLGRHAITVAHWRNAQSGQVVTAETRGLVADLYERLWGTDGPSVVAQRRAAQAGMQPFEAWTDAIIDDPTAAPYSDPEAVQFVDEVLVKAVVRGQRPFLDLSPAEQLQLYRAHVAAGRSVRSFRDRYRPVPAPILKQLQSQVTA